MQLILELVSWSSGRALPRLGPAVNANGSTGPVLGLANQLGHPVSTRSIGNWIKVGRVQHRHGRVAVLLECACHEPRTRLQVDGKAEGELVRNQVEHLLQDGVPRPGREKRRA